MKNLFIFASVMIVLFMAAPNEVDAQKRTAVKTLVGTISGFECGDNCYLTITDKNGKEHVVLCMARPLCTKWNAATEMPDSYKEKRVTFTVGKGKQYNDAGQVMGTMDSFTTLRFLAEPQSIPLAVHAQKRPELPAKLDAYEGKDPDHFMKLPGVRARLRTLLGMYYNDFTERIHQGEFKRNGQFLSVEGQMPHYGFMEVAILIIDMENRTLHCGLFSDGTVGFAKQPKKKKSGLLKFSETPAKMPDVLTNWSN